MPDPIQVAEDRFNQGYSCSQAVFSAFSPQFGVEEDVALKIASPFGGGIAHQGEVCGAVLGALMVLALKFGTNGFPGQSQIYTVSQEFIHRFESRHGFILCRKLTSFDISHPQGLQAARDAQVFKKICPELVKTAAGIVQSMLASTSG